MSGGGLDLKQELQDAKAALVRAVDTCARLETKYDNAQTELKEHMRAYPGDTDSAMYKILVGALERAYAAYEDARKQVDKAQDGVNAAWTQAGQAPQNNVQSLGAQLAGLRAQVAELYTTHQDTPRKRAAPWDACLTSPSKRSRPSVGSGDGTPRTLGQVQAWKYTATVTNPLRARHLRKNVFTCAADSVAYFGSIRYAESIPDGTPYDSLLVCELFFESRAAGSNFDTQLRALVERTYNSDLIEHLSPSLTEAYHELSLTEKVGYSSYKAAPPSPDRANGDGVVEPAESRTATSMKVRDPVVMEQEAITNPRLSVDGYPLQWCHILPNGERDNASNRLLMDSLLHGYYDHGHMSVYCRGEDIPLLDEDNPQEVKLQLIFADTGIATIAAGLLREGRVRRGTRQFEVTITKPKARSFALSFVNQRHATNVAAQSLLEETAMLPTVSPEDDLDEVESHMHEHKRKTRGSAPGLEWTCECHTHSLPGTKHQYECVVEGCDAKLCTECDQA